MKTYKYARSAVNINTPVEVLELYKERIRYNPDTGELYNIKTDKVYTNKNPKGYINEISIRYDNIEYIWVSHRLCWFLGTGEILADNLQIDHKNRIKDDNRLDNLRKVTNQQNQANVGATDKTSSYKGVHVTYDLKKNGIKYKHFVANIRVNNHSMKIGRFKDEILAAKYYDAAARFYFEEFANVNFEEVFIEPNLVSKLRIHKLVNKH